MNIRIQVAAATTVLAAMAAMTAPPAHAADALTVVNYGGANGAAQRKTFVEPYTKSTGVPVTVVEYAGEQAKVKAMVDAGRVTWDVVEVESADVKRGCDQGLYEPLDWSALGGKSQFLPQAVTECGAGFFVWATVLAYNKGLVQGTPGGWQDFWDVKKFPGKRGLRKSARGTLEFALMADGVAPSEVYAQLATQAGVDRAFKQLDKLKPYILWWTAGAQAAQILVAGDVAMTTSFGGRVRTAMTDGANIGIVWRQTLSDLDYWVIPKGAPNKALAEKYIAYTLQAGPQKAFVTTYPNGPVNLDAFKQMTADQLESMPNSPDNLKTALIQNAEFWNEHGDDLDQRFAAWAAR
jgi:putative spermidine/putrescine transport system substrate-binding protein